MLRRRQSRRDLAGEAGVADDQVAVRAQRAAAALAVEIREHERRHRLAVDALRRGRRRAPARSAARRRRGSRPAAGRGGGRRRRAPSAPGRSAPLRRPTRPAPTPAARLGRRRRAAARRCGSRAPARRSSRAARPSPARRGATSRPRRRRARSTCASACRSAETSGGVGQPRWTPPRPPVASTRMPAAPQTASVPPTVVAPIARWTTAVGDVARAELARGGVEPAELVGRQPDDDLAVEHADRRRHGASPRAPPPRRRARPRRPRRAGSRARRASSRARRRPAPRAPRRRSGSRHRSRPARSSGRPPRRRAPGRRRGSRRRAHRRRRSCRRRRPAAPGSRGRRPRVRAHRASAPSSVSSAPTAVLLCLGREGQVGRELAGASRGTRRRRATTTRRRARRARRSAAREPCAGECGGGDRLAQQGVAGDVQHVAIEPRLVEIVRRELGRGAAVGRHRAVAGGGDRDDDARPAGGRPDHLDPLRPQCVPDELRRRRRRRARPTTRAVAPSAAAQAATFAAWPPGAAIVVAIRSSPAASGPSTRTITSSSRSPSRRQPHEYDRRMDDTGRRSRLRSFAIGGLIGAAGAIATVRRRSRALERRAGAPEGPRRVRGRAVLPRDDGRGGQEAREADAADGA